MLKRLSLHITQNRKHIFLAQIKIQTIYANKFPSLRTNQNHCISFFLCIFLFKDKKYSEMQTAKFEIK